MIKKIIAMTLAVIMIMSVIPAQVMAATGAEAPTISVVGGYAAPGQSVEVKIIIENNDGIFGSILTLEFDSYLTLTEATAGDAFSELVLTNPGTFSSPCSFVWDGQAEPAVEDGTILTLKFNVSDTAPAYERLGIRLSYEDGDIVDSNFDAVSPTINNGYISVIDYIPGDVNGDGLINTIDITWLRRYRAGGYDVTINEYASDVNDDDRINTIDITWLRRYRAGGYGIELLPHTPRCTHTDLTRVEAKEATCTEDGNIAYWQCNTCGKYFSDAEAKNEITFAQTIIPKIILNTANIVYKLINNDSYLANQTIINPNPNSYVIGEGLTLSNNIEVPGYTFVGWFDSFAPNATQIKVISSSDSSDKELYAHWDVYQYKIEFESDLIPVADEYYTVNQGKLLPTPKLAGYSFVGWSDENGEIIRRIPVGTTGDKKYTANWLSDRNQAWTKKSVDDPIIIEEDNKILFVYEIGEIRNVPVSVIHDFGKIVGGGVASEQTVSHSKTVSSSEIMNFAKTVENATTENYGITLSSGWSDGMTVSEDYCRQNDLTQEEAQALATNESNNWYVSSGKSGSSTTTTFNTTDTTDMTTGTSNKSGTTSLSAEGSKSSTHTEESHKDFSFDEKIGASGKVGPVKLSGGFEANQSFGSSKSDSTTNTSKTALGASATVSNGSSQQEGTVTHTGSNSTSTGSWNTDSGRGASTSVTNTLSTSKIISESISEKTGYGKSYIKTGSEASNQGFSYQQSTSDSYSTGITYSTSETDTLTETITTTNTIEGYHRWVWATTAHVFMVVGYDIATSSYFTCNYSILDEDVKRFEDYSYNTSSYDDNQTGVITFEIPTDIKDYVYSRISGSEGLQYSRDGKVTGYTGTDDFVVIPEYKVINGTVIKVTGISENAFKGKVNLQNGTDEFLGLELSEFITEIPNGAFENCSSLKYIDLKNVTHIGDRAFAGCNSLKTTKLNDGVTYLGQNAFENLDALLIYASNKSVAEAASKSGAKAIALIISDKCNDLSNTTLEIPEGTEFFGFYGDISKPRSFNDVNIVSNADETLILNANFESTKKHRLQFLLKLFSGEKAM